MDASSSFPPTNPPPDTPGAAAPRALRADLGFRRLAVVLSGGGALGAYEIGVLRVLERLRVTPALVIGVSVGAINATAWLAHGCRSAELERTWRGLRASTIGMRWLTLALRWAGLVLAIVSALEVVTTFAGSRELSGAYWLWRKSSGRIDVASAILDAAAWAIAAGFGIAIVLLSRPMEDWLARGGGQASPARARRVLGWTVLVLAVMHAVVWVFGWPWPHRFSAMLILVLFVAWAMNSPDQGGHRLRAALFALMPETGGRGLWTGHARRRVIEQLVASGDTSNLIDGTPRLVVSALAIDSGRVCHFVNWPNPEDSFVRRLGHELGEVVVLHSPADVIAATVASSAIPGVFEPVPVGPRKFVDAGGFSNQPLHVALADHADAVLVVLLSASAQPTRTGGAENVIELAGRLLELANWRDLQAELRHLPEGWTRAVDGTGAGASQTPARVCVVEPDGVLPGGVLSFDARAIDALIARGERDAWRALERAGWLATGSPASAPRLPGGLP